MTSNLGSELIKDQAQKASLGFTSSQEKTGAQEIIEEKIHQTLKETFKPEFLNRIDEIIIFKPLNKDAIEKIVELQLKKVFDRLKEKKINLKVNKDAKDLIAEMGFDPVYGARPLKRVIQQYILDPLSLKIISGETELNKTFKVGVKNKKIVIS